MPTPIRMLALLWVLRLCHADNAFLYMDSDVLEMSQSGADELLAQRTAESPRTAVQPHITVFYAHWCGHCKQYAPRFKELAARSVNASVPGAGGVSFRAVNCVKFSALCDTYAVKAYPTVKAFDFPDDPASLSWKGSEVKSNAVDQYVQTHTAASGQSSLAGRTSLGGVNTTSMQAWLTQTASPLPLGPSALPEDRLRDALETLSFLVLVELAHGSTPSSSWTHWRGTGLNGSRITATGNDVQKAEVRVRRGVLAQLCLMVAAFLPQDGSTEIPALRTVAAELAIDEPDKQVVFRALQRASPEELRWTRCGVMANGRSDAGVAEGYTCGLWMLLHLLTVTAQPHARIISTHRVMSTIRAVVNLHFRCAECRQHFLAAFDACSWGRCAVGAHDYRALQLWLWTFHNKVTHRIMSFRFLRGLFAAPVRARPVVGSNRSIDTLYPDVLWPSSAECPDCRKTGHTLLAVAVDEGDKSVGAPSYYRTTSQVSWDEDAVVQFLNKQYSIGVVLTNQTVLIRDYAAFDRDIDMSSRLDAQGRVIGTSGSGHPSRWAIRAVEWSVHRP